MNKMLIYPLIILFLICLFSQTYAVSTGLYDNIDFSYNNTLSSDSQSGTISQNGTNTEISTEETNTLISVNMTGGLIALIVVLIVVGVVAGIQVLGSGLNEASVKLIYSSTVWFGLWGIFSGLSYIAFSSIPVFGMGAVIWFILTLIYTLGFFDKTTGS